MADQPNHTGDQNISASQPPAAQIGPVDKAWIDLAVEASPARAMAHVDSTLAFVAALVTGFGALALSLHGLEGTARLYMLSAITSAFISIYCAVIAQLGAIPYPARPRTLPRLRKQYYRLETRVRYTRFSACFLLLAIVLGFLAAERTYFTPKPISPVITLSQIRDGSGGSITGSGNSSSPSTITVKAAFQGLSLGDEIAVSIIRSSQLLGWSMATAGTDGTASPTLTVSQIPAGAAVIVEIDSPKLTCKTEFNTGQNPEAITCHRT